LLKASKQLAEKYASGTTFKELSGKFFSILPIPLPPHKEQKRIVERIEELLSDIDQGVESLKTAQKQLKVYRQAVLKWAFEGKLTEAWRKAARPINYQNWGSVVDSNQGRAREPRSATVGRVGNGC